MLIRINHNNSKLGSRSEIFVVVGKNRPAEDRWWEVKEEQLITSANDERSERGALLCFLAPLQSFVEARN